jgi:nitrogen fixation NifU-like protein
MSDLRDLYQELIIDHGRRPRNFGRLEGANHSADGHNPLCGDRLTLYLREEGGVVVEVAFEGSGCAISTASTSMLTEALRGMPVGEARRLARRFIASLTDPETDVPADELGKLAVFAGVKEFPTRVKCATLAWHTLEAALDDEDAPASTE